MFIGWIKMQHGAAPSVSGMLSEFRKQLHHNSRGFPYPGMVLPRAVSLQYHVYRCTRLDREGIINIHYLLFK